MNACCCSQTSTCSTTTCSTVSCGPIRHPSPTPTPPPPSDSLLRPAPPSKRSPTYASSAVPTCRTQWSALSSSPS
ncbi:hypothetical protein DVZ84_32620 [Streptomyces parvulus]|uniref:Uncharacterized protein n=1 Tax=Streptomyces parvulus TaxID=146923 RepID=A0A369UWQ2_9ACTN|nr:hypothetical protein GEV49_03840 [Streptomyces sp. SYP-A7193]RDD84921.1 hypothetical protein DVZ84_32620 [Streptomyces parvulus]